MTLSGFLCAQGGTYNVQFKKYTVKDGLGHNHIYQNFIDSRGILWVLTETGLQRFDGLDFKQVVDLDVKDIHNSRIYFEDDEGNLWIKHTRSQVFLLNIFTEKIHTPEEKLKGTLPDPVDCLVQGNAGTILVQGPADTIWRYSESKPPEVVFARPGCELNPLVERPNGTIWIDFRGKKDGYMLAYNPMWEASRTIPYPNDTIYHKGAWGADSVYFITPDRFVVANESGVLHETKLSSKLLDLVEINPYIDGAFPVSYVDPETQFIWLAKGGRLRLLNSNAEVIFDLNQSDPRFNMNRIFSIEMDHQKNLWLSTFGGLYHIQVKKNHFRRFFCAETSDFWDGRKFGCRKILRTSDGRILVAGEAYIMQLQGEKESLVWENKSPERIGLRGLLSKPDGTLWFADQQLFRRSPSGKVDSWMPGNLGRMHLRSWSILEEDGRLLLDFPLSFFDLEKKEIFPFDQYNGFEEMRMSEIYEARQDQTGLWWLLTHTGLYTYRPGKGILSRYWSGGTGAYYLPVDNFRSSYEEPDGSWWLATGSGLLYWDRNRGTHRLYTTKDGLSNSICHSVLSDSNGFLWISSDFGLMQFEKKTGRVKTYLGIDGLGMDEFNRISFFHDTITGQFYFGGIDGIIRMDPDDFADQFMEDVGVELVLTEAILFSGETQAEESVKQTFFETGEIVIHPGDRFLRLQFALTDYKNTSSIRYEYLIEGHEDVWHGGQGNALRLAGLPYGTYTLRVRSKSITGFGTDRELQIPLNVLKPFYLQWWFLLVVLSIFAGSFLLYVRWRTQALKSQAVKLEAAVKERTQTIELQKEKLDAMRMFQARLYSNVTHEFRTPLTLILGLTNQLKNKLKGVTQPVPESLDQIDQNARHILELVNQLLDINKLEDDKMLPEYRQGDVVAFIQRIMVPYQLLSEAKEIKWSFASSHVAFEMDFDADKLQKIVANLWSNAIKFTPPGGWIKVGLQADGEYLSLEVSDSGPGIPEDRLEFVFDRFYQVDNSLTRMAQGTGIGLALVKELAALLGGTIAVKSALGKGASFTLKLPITNVAERLDEQFAEPVGMAVPNGVQSISIQDKADTETGAIQVLLIEDHRGLAEYIRSCLGDRYAVVHIEDGMEGLQYAIEAVPDVIISDVMLPGMDGFSICERLKNDERTSHIPVIILTALTQHTDRVKALQGGADAVLTKPFNEDELLIRIDQLLLLRKKLQAWYLSNEPYRPQEIAASEDAILNKEMDFVNKCKSLILSDLENAELDAKSLAHSTGLSASQLHRKLTALTGLAPGRFIYDVRLQAAQQKLEETDLLVSEIAYQCGFNDPAYFSRLFAKKFGHPPSYYRK